MARILAPSFALFMSTRTCRVAAKEAPGHQGCALEKLVAALRDPLTLDSAQAEWVADQLLESGEKGILLPVNVVLDAYIRGKSRRAQLGPCPMPYWFIPCGNSQPFAVDALSKSKTNAVRQQKPLCASSLSLHCAIHLLY